MAEISLLQMKFEVKVRRIGAVVSLALDTSSVISGDLTT